MAIASGDLPDVMVVNYGMFQELASAGALEDMTDVYATYASDHVRACTDSGMGISEDMATVDGRLMGIPIVGNGINAVKILNIRADWLEELGLEVPETWDEVMDVARAFMEKNPGGNVTEGFAVLGDLVKLGYGQFYGTSLFTYHDSYPYLWLKQEDGQLMNGAIAEETKTALAAIRELVEEGLINPAFVTRGRDQCLELVANGNVGMFWGSWDILQFLTPTIASADMEWVQTLAPYNDDGMVNVQAQTPTSNFVVVKKGVSEEVKEAIMKTINLQNELNASQAEGVRPNGLETPFHFRMFPINFTNGRYDGKEVQIQSVIDCFDGKLAYDDLDGDSKTWYNGLKTVAEKGWDGAYAEAEALCNAWGWASGALTVHNNSDRIDYATCDAYWATTPSINENQGTYETVMKEYFVKVLLGDADLDKTWDEYVANWLKAGGEAATKEINELMASK